MLHLHLRLCLHRFRRLRAGRLLQVRHKTEPPALNRPHDRLRGAVTSSGEAWLEPDTSALHGSRAPNPPDDVRTNYWPLVAAGEYPREGQPASRIVAFGDADVASNRYLRALYNLDLVDFAVC